MSTFLVASRSDGCAGAKRRGFDPLHAALREAGSFVEPMDSVWIVSTTLTARQLYKKVVPFLDGGDRVMVVECGNDTEWRGMPFDVSLWLDREFASIRLRAARRRSG